MNWYPLYFATGGKIQSISKDWKQVDLKLSLNFWTRNYVGTIFGGSMFAASDPFYMIMFIQVLGKDYVVWDKGAAIKFKRPGIEKLTMELIISDSEIEDIKAKVKITGELELTKKLEWKDSSGKVICEIDRLLYFATKEHYRAKREKRLLK